VGTGRRFEGRNRVAIAADEIAINLGPAPGRYLAWYGLRYRRPQIGQIVSAMNGANHVIPQWLKRNAVVPFFAVLLFSTWAISRVELIPGPEFKIVQPGPVSGDEPIYFATTLNILFNHRLAWDGVAGPDTLLVNRRTGRAYLWYTKDPSFFTPAADYYTVSGHSCAYPLLLASCVMAFFHMEGSHGSIQEALRDLFLVIVTIIWLGALITYAFARRIGMERWLAMLAVVVLMSSPWLAYSKSFYTEPGIGLCLALALLALESGRPKLAALGSAAAMYLKSPFGLIGAGLILERLWSRRWREAIEMSGVLGVCGVALVGFNYWLARTPIIIGSTISVGAGNSEGSHPEVTLLHSLYQTMLGPGVGVMDCAPWTIFGFAFLLFALFGKPSTLRRIAFPTALYGVGLVLSKTGPGTCYGPRYWVPMLPWLAIASVEGMRWLSWQRPITYLLRTGYAAAVILSAAMAIPAALRYPQMFNHPVTFYPWYGLSAVGPTVDTGFIEYRAYRQAYHPGESKYYGEQYLWGRGKVVRTGSTDNSLSFEVDLPKRTMMVVNQYYDSNWHVADGSGEVISWEGLLAVALPSGRQQITLIYRPHHFRAGVLIALIAMSILAWLWLFEWRCEPRAPA